MKTLHSEDMIAMFDKYKNEYVIKEDGLNGGKGVKLSGEHFENDGEAYAHCDKLVTKGSNFLFEEKLVGDEFSLMSFCDGETLKSMPIVQDFKRANNGDKGLNTGGMGCISHTNHMLDFLTGNIVRWDGSLWIVQECSEFPRSVELISADLGNTTAMVTETFPEQKKRQIDSIEWVAATMKEFVNERLTKTMWEK